MKIAVITTGDEVLQGIIVDSNSAWISERCVEAGHDVILHASAPDDMDAIGSVLSCAAQRADCVMVTGGLGPTADDITIEAAARAFGVNLVRDEGVMREISSFFERIGRPMSSSNDKQALVPDGSEILPNRVGTAPGVKVKLGEADFIFLPGVPKELYQIFSDSVEPWLSGCAEGARASLVLRCFGLPEASIDERLQGVDLCGARLSFRVKFPEILLKLVARADAEGKAKGTVEAASDNIRDRLGHVVYGEGERTLAGVVGEMLLAKGMRLAVAESCTGGLISSTITDVPGASRWFDRGLVTYSNESKEQELGVAHGLIAERGAVSEDVARAMAEGVRDGSGADIGLAVTGIAGPDGGSEAKPVGTVHIALASVDETGAWEYHFRHERLWFKQLVAATALDHVRRYLIR